MGLISIHAPLAGSDQVSSRPLTACRDFNPRSPRGERLIRLLNPSPSLLFQSTLPSRGATYPSPRYCLDSNISIHAPLAGSDNPPQRNTRTNTNFNPRSPRGERPKGISRKVTANQISIHAPLAGSDMTEYTRYPESKDFNPRSPRGERQLSK